MNPALKLEKEQLPPLPDEMWICIFEYLSHEERRNIQSISDHLAKIIDDMPPPPSLSWIHCYPRNAHTSSTFTDAMILFRKTPATKFRYAVDINKLQIKIDQQLLTNERSNPFQNASLTIDWTCVQEFSAMHYTLPTFLQEHGHHVQKLLYYIHDLVPQCVHNLELILRKMPNLKSVTFFSPTWNTIPIRGSYFANFSDMNSLSELTVLGAGNMNFIQAFVTRYGRQIRCLHWGQRRFLQNDRDYENPLTQVVAKCVNLDIFKIADCSIGSFPLTTDVLSIALKQFAIRVTPSEDIDSRSANDKVLHIILDITNALSTTLETLCLHVYPTAMKPFEIRSGWPGGPFPCVKELSLLYAAVDHPFFRACLQACPELKYLILLDTKLEFKSINVKADKNKLVNVEVSRHLWSLVGGTKVLKIWIQTSRLDEKTKKQKEYVFEVINMLEES
ncbi:unnamed protein product [Orchesella dallaii]|uniref:F-box domain-containing protein n=1 Tax=Orchesella dallaii TaxID=48710 RepID=A0ABP1R2S4_9HEXA